MPIVYLVCDVVYFENGKSIRDPRFTKLRYYPMLQTYGGNWVLYADDGEPCYKEYNQFKMYKITDGKVAIWTRKKEEGDEPKRTDWCL